MLSSAPATGKEPDAVPLDVLHEPAPDFALDADHSLAGMRGKWVILHFWATWCTSCVKELPALERLYSRWANHDVEFVAVAMDAGNRAGVEEFVQRLNITLPVYLQDNVHAPEVYATWGLPATYFINPEGQVMARALGPREWDSQSADQLLQSLVNAR
jgi:thiol-disulfide isomerase/thioredoxin